MIKINLVREGRGPVRGAAAAPMASVSSGPSNLNGLLLIGLLILGALAGGAYWFMKNQELKNKQAEVALREAEAKKLESIIKEVEEYQARKDSLEQRIKLINDLKKNQKNPVMLMDRVSWDLPDLVWLETMDLKQTSINVTGRALNANAVATFVANIKGDPLFQEPKLSTLARCAVAGGINVFCFEMSVVLIAPELPEEGDAAAEEGTPGGESAADSV